MHKQNNPANLLTEVLDLDRAWEPDLMRGTQRFSYIFSQNSDLSFQSFKAAFLPASAPGIRGGATAAPKTRIQLVTSVHMLNKETISGLWVFNSHSVGEKISPYLL